MVELRDAAQEPGSARRRDRRSDAAEHIGQDTPLPSLEVATEGRGGGGACDRDYGCSYGGTISFRTPSTPLPMEADPRKLFERLFGQGDTADERKTIVRQYSSILDLVSQEAADLQTQSRRAGPREAWRLSGNRSRNRTARAEDGESRISPASTCPTSPSAPRFDEQLNLMFDMVALAYQANLTRVFTLHDGGRRQQRARTTRLACPDSFHPLSHHQNDKARKERLVKIQTYNTQVFAKFLDQAGKMPDGDGSMLDHSIMLYGSNMSNSNAHNHFPLPTPWSAADGQDQGRSAPASIRTRRRWRTCC